ncbi:complement C1q tumor necrosis factor-related protein 3-like [Branchiostoma floridae]|uniref:Complement C1q tumor necrosis factor-related protein 3-like n=1 Tax=Branchiostoma floridae TaxID=7739 RepID=A0A9J7N0A5_BRAFL|nr:complement C1q tumor necrosis factor-related protein 3-like [Branchiostoma floridae]
MAQAGFFFASLVLLVSTTIQVTSAHELAASEGSCSRQFSSDVNITVVAGPGQDGQKGDMGPRGHKGVPGNRGVTGDPGEQGPAGPIGEKGGTGERGPAGETGSPGVSRPEPTLVAFSVARTTDLQTSWSATVVTYDDVLSNVGEAYDMATGKFVTKVSGVYFFTFTAMTRQEYLMHLKKNGDTMVSTREKYTYDNEGENMSSSISAILQLRRGDRVWVELFPGRYSLSNNGNRFNTFSGFLISQL